MNRRKGAAASWRNARMSLWLAPSVAAVGAYLLGHWLSQVSWGASLFAAGASGGRTILTALVGGLVTALSVIFSLTISALQTVHAQYSPRLLRNFIRDRATKITLSVFAGTVAYMLAVLRAIPSSDSEADVPRLAIALGMLLFLACVGVVAYFAQHITNSMRVHHAMDRVLVDTQRALTLMDRTTSAQGRATLRKALPAPPAGAVAVTASRSGYVLEVDVERLTRLAGRAGISIRMRPMVGDQVVAGTPLAWVWPRAGEMPPPDRLDREIGASTEIGSHRDQDTDVPYGLRQLVDVVVRAMSPSLSDPYTAVQAIDHIAIVLCRVARDGVPDGLVHDESGALLVAVPGADLLDYLRLAIDQPLRYGRHEPAVAVRMLNMLRDLGTMAPEEMRPHLRAEVARVRDDLERHAAETADLAGVRSESEEALSWIDGRIAAPGASYLRL